MKKLKKSVIDWNFKEKLIFTITLLVFYRLGVMVPLPFVNSHVFSDAVTQSEIAGGVLSAATMVGGSLTQLGVFSLGVMPFITASIVFQLLKVAIPSLQQLGQTDTGRKQITQWTRYLTVFLAIFEAFGIVLAAPSLLGVNIFTESSMFVRIFVVFIMVAGTLAVMRMGEEITAKGIGNGASLIIFTSILANIPRLVNESFIAKGFVASFWLLVILFTILGIVAFVEKCEYRVNVVYTKSDGGVLKNRNNLPVKLAIAGVLPVIFSSVLISLPRLVENFTKNEKLQSLGKILGPGTIGYGVIFTILTVAMTFFSIVVVFNVHEIAKNIQSQGGFISGKRPGESTAKYLKFIANKMAGIDAVYLAGIGLVPLYLFPLVGVSEVAFGATSIIILCTVIVTVLAVVDTERKTAVVKKSSFLYKIDKK